MLKETGVLKSDEGKMPFTLQGYGLLSRVSLRSLRDGIFFHCFLVLTWNLVNRSVSTATMVFQHLQWFGDALLVDLPRSKSDQGVSVSSPRCVFCEAYIYLLCIYYYYM